MTLTPRDSATSGVSGAVVPEAPKTPELSLTNPQEIRALNDLEEIKNFVAWVDEKYKSAKSARARIERQWRMNLHFYYGKQNVAFNSDRGRFYTPKAPPWRVRSVTNRIRPIIRNELARVTSNRPHASVVPASSEDKDLFAAQAAEQAWQSEYTNKKLHYIYSRAAWWMLITGTGFIKDWYDPDKPSDYFLDKNGDSLAIGDNSYAVVTPFHLFVPDLREPEIENQPFVIEASVKPVEYIKQMYGEEFNPSIVASNELIEDDTLNLASGDTQPDSVLCLEVWFKPGSHRRFPKGGYALIVDNRLVKLHDSGMLYHHGEFPYTKFEHIPTGTFYGESTITDLILPQREYNRTRSQIIESKNRMAKPQLTAAKGTVDPAKITSEPGQVIEYLPGFGPPSPLPIQPIPAYVQQELDVIIRDMEDISSQHEVSRGQAPGSVTAATAISYLQEKDDSAFTHTYQSIEYGFEKLAKHTLSHIVQFWDMPRLVRTTGVDGSFDALMLKGSQIRNGLDLRIESGSALPTSKAARQAFIMDMMKMGFIDPNRGLELMEIGGTQRLYEELKTDERQAQRENLRMANLRLEEIEKFKAEQAQQFMRQAQIAELFQNAMNTPPGMGGDMGGEMPLPGMEDSGLPPEMGGPVGPPEMAGLGAGGFTDANTGMLAPPPINMVPVNSWDNHALHIEVHNRYRKTQAFELLPDPIKEQFEAHVRAHANALNSAAMGAQMMPPPPVRGGDPNSMFENSPGQMGPEGGQGPDGSNQFGPPGMGPQQQQTGGSEEMMPPPPM